MGSVVEYLNVRTDGAYTHRYQWDLNVKSILGCYIRFSVAVFVDLPITGILVGHILETESVAIHR